jgi:hypothetical protein
MIAAQVLLDGLQAEDFGSSVESPGEHQCRRDVGLSGSRTKIRGNPPRERAAEFAITRERMHAGTLDGPASTNRVKRPEQLHDQNGHTRCDAEFP